MTPT
ncbi:hypothetical protein YPPY52_1258, partial [Yersinia pestis PY-52]|jgi:hypothetical protein